MRYHERIMSRSRVATRRIARTVFVTCLVTAPVVGITACRAFANYDYATLDKSSSTDDLGDSACDLHLPSDRFVRDASGDDAQGTDLPNSDVPQHDILPDATPGFCGSVPSSVIAHYTFDNVATTHPVVNAQGTGAPDGTTVGTWGSDITSVAGPTGCGQALAFTTTATPPHRYVEIPSSSAVQNLKEGSIGLWVKFDAKATNIQGILSRDAMKQTQGGHLTLYRFKSTPETGNKQVLAIRLQAKITSEGVEAESIACASAPSLHTWHHVVVTFGPPSSSPPHDDLEIYVDGSKGSDTSSQEQWIHCNHGVNHTMTGITGNHNPWVLGASAHSSSEGKADKLDAPFVGAIDDLRIHNARILP